MLDPGLAFITVRSGFNSSGLAMKLPVQDCQPVPPTEKLPPAARAMVCEPTVTNAAPLLSVDRSMVKA
jgi:hypothetical protein